MPIKKLLSNYEPALQDMLESRKSLAEKYSRMSEAEYRVGKDRVIGQSLQQSIHHSVGQSNDMQSFYTNEHIASQTEPILVSSLKHYVGFFLRRLAELPLSGTNGHTWIYQSAIYCITGTNTEDEQRLLVLDFVDNERQKFERLKAKFSSEQAEQVKYERTRIPEHVRIEVWRRDQGKCAGCGSREKLEYDHIVPVSRGGSNTARNVELLCEECNRAKGDRIQ